MEIDVKKILTEDEFSELFDSPTIPELEEYYEQYPEEKKELPKCSPPSFVDGNEDEWIKWFYESGYRLVKLKTLEEWAPKEFGYEFTDTRAFKFRNVRVIKEHDGTVDAWIGTHKYVYNWVELENGYAVGWNENPSRGWAFLVVKIKKISRMLKK